ncbi:MAG: hypothetical protein KBD53_07925 [Candidatus Omnitrophica bacterium]|nr:hypothetical protein [Candidatus Omnitrophota bacterium]
MSVCRFKKMLWCSINISTIFILCSSPSYSEEKVIFKFNPPDGISYRQMYSAEQIKDFGGIKKQINLTEETVKVVIKKDEKGYLLMAKPFLVTMTRDGHLVPESNLKLMLGINYVLHLDAKGLFLNIDGFEEFVNILKAELPEDIAKEALKNINVEAMIDKEEDEYSNRIGDLIGREIKVGDTWYMDGKSILPDGNTVDYTSVYRLKEMVSCGATRCAKIEYHYDANPAGLRTIINEFYTGLDEKMGERLRGMNSVDTKFFGNGTRLVDPKTMLIYLEDMHEVTEVPMTLANNAKISMMLTENKHYGYKYDQSGETKDEY